MTVYINGTTGYTGPIGAVGDFSTTGNTTLGDASTDKTTINGKLWSYVDGTTTQQYHSFGDGTTTYASVGGYYDSSTTGHLEFYTLNSTLQERMRIDNAGNVGVGVTPSGSWGTQALMLGKSGAANPTYPFLASTDSQTINIGNNTYWNGSVWKAQFASAITATRFEVSYNEFAWYNAAAVSAGTTQSFTKAMTLDASGNLLVNNTNGTYRTTIVQDGGSNTNSSLTGSALVLGRTNGYSEALGFRVLSSGTGIGGTTYAGQIQGNGVNALEMYTAGVAPIVFGISATEKARIDTSGNLLVGTTSAFAKLTVAATSAGAGVFTFNSRFGSSSYATGDYSVTAYGVEVNSSFAKGAFGWHRQNSYDVGDFIWALNSTTDGSNVTTSNIKMTLDSSGNLLVACTSTGVTVDGLRLLATGVAQFSRSNGDALSVNRNASDGACAVWYRAGTQVGSVSVTGSATTYNTSSDYRLKDVTGPVTGTEAKNFIMALQPKQGTWKVDGSKFVGFLAHEFQEVSPTSVTGEKDAVDDDGNPIMQAMQSSSSEVMANLIALVQEQQALITQLQADVSALKGN